MKTLLLMTCLWLAGVLPTRAQTYTKYLFVYFPSNSNENIYYALSDKDSPFDFVPMNNGQMIVSADTIALKKGVRDPHVLRGEDGWFYMVNTDMRCAEGWDSNRGIVLMRSRDLVNWTHTTVHFPTKYAGTQFANVTRVWAPETIWDPEAQKYMVYFSLLTNDGTIPYDKVFYCYANEDFTDLVGEPTYLYDRGSATIDMDIVYNDQDGLYHAVYKNEGAGGICQVTASRLTTLPGQELGSQWSTPSSTLQQTRVAVEGAGLWRLIDSDKWILMYDCYGSGYYQFCESTDLISFKLLHQTQTQGMFTPRHGTVLPVTDEEVETINRLLKEKHRDEAVNDLREELERAVLLGLDVSQGRQLLAQEQPPVAEIEAATNNLKMAAYDYVSTTYTEDVTAKLGNWTNDNVTTLRGQHWSNERAATYYEQDKGWTLNTWQMSMRQTLTLPAGNYLLKVACRSASEAVVATVSIGNVKVDFPHKGDTGYGITTDGKACFDPDGTYANDGLGRGWEWRYVPFTVKDGQSVDIVISGNVANANQQWLSFTNITLLTTPASTGLVPLEASFLKALPVFDLAGRRLSSAYAKGFVISGGKMLLNR